MGGCALWEYSWADEVGIYNAHFQEDRYSNFWVGAWIVMWQIYGAIQSCFLSTSDLVGTVVTLLMRTGVGVECIPGDGVHRIPIGGILVLGKSIL